MMSNDWSTADIIDTLMSQPDDTHKETPKFEVFLPGLQHYGGHQQFSGPAVLARCFEDNSCVKQLLNSSGWCEKQQVGKVLVVDGANSLRCALLGDQIATSAIEQGWTGIIIAGCVRDTKILKNLPIGIMALASTPRKSIRRGVGESELSRMDICGVEIEAGVQVYADEDGVLVVSS